MMSSQPTAAYCPSSFVYTNFTRPVRSARCLFGVASGLSVASGSKFSNLPIICQPYLADFGSVFFDRRNFGSQVRLTESCSGSPSEQMSEKKRCQERCARVTDRNRAKCIFFQLFCSGIVKNEGSVERRVRRSVVTAVSKTCTRLWQEACRKEAYLQVKIVKNRGACRCGVKHFCNKIVKQKLRVYINGAIKMFFQVDMIIWCTPLWSGAP